MAMTGERGDSSRSLVFSLNFGDNSKLESSLGFTHLNFYYFFIFCERIVEKGSKRIRNFPKSKSEQLPLPKLEDVRRKEQT